MTRSVQDARGAQRNPYELGLGLVAIASILVGLVCWLIAIVLSKLAMSGPYDLLQTKDQYLAGFPSFYSPEQAALSDFGLHAAAFGVLLLTTLLVIRSLRWRPTPTP